MKSKVSVCIQLTLTIFFLAGCSVQQFAVNSLGDALSGTGTTFSADEDPELIGEALPFSLKLMESVLAETPQHEGLLTALASGFTQYAYGWVQQPADEIEDDDYDRAEELRNRAIKLYLRAHRYGMRGLEERYPGFGYDLREDSEGTLDQLESSDMELLYWTALSWAGATSLSLDDVNLVGELAYIEAMMTRALELDPDWDMGSVHSFFITYEMSRMNGTGDPVENATKHYNRALELSEGKLASIYVSYAESVAVDQQNKELFMELLNKALSIDVDESPELRLNNLLYQRRAKWLLNRLDWLFL